MMFDVSRIKHSLAQFLSLFDEGGQIFRVFRMKYRTGAIINDHRTLFAGVMKPRKSDHAIGNVDRFVQFVGHNEDRVLGHTTFLFGLQVFLIEA